MYVGQRDTNMKPDKKRTGNPSFPLHNKYVSLFISILHMALSIKSQAASYSSQSQKRACCCCCCCSSSNPFRISCFQHSTYMINYCFRWTDGGKEEKAEGVWRNPSKSLLPSLAFPGNNLLLLLGENVSCYVISKPHWKSTLIKREYLADKSFRWMPA